MSIIQQILLNSIADPKKFSQQPSSLCVRFRLLLLCLNFIQTGFIQNNNKQIIEVFMERIYNVALNWFTKSPMWYDASTRKLLEDDVRILIDFAKTMEETNLLQSSTSSSSTTITTSNLTSTLTEINTPGALISRILPSTSRDKKTTTQTINSSENQGNNKQQTQTQQTQQTLTGSYIDSLSSSSNNSSFPSSNLYNSSSGSSSSSSSYLNNNYQIIYNYGKHKISLLLLLIGHEIDRMAAWHNPQNRIKLKLPDEQRYTTEKYIHGAQWRRYIKTAWSLSPQLAIMLGERFPFPKVRGTIARYVVENSDSVWRIPNAINYLATPDNVENKFHGLSNLLYWATTTPPNALSLLSPLYNSHPYITQYAIRVLRSFPPDTIVFYIPQLVQTIRYDKSGLVEKYLLSASQHSQVLAHQLIWNLQTYTQDPEKTQYPLALKATNLRQQIIDLFSDVFRANYENEFQFFERVTNISGILKPREPKNEQRQILKAKLKEIEITPKLYLPTSPDTTVTGINPDKASPMQSAAKVPILVTFLVSNIPALDYNSPDNNLSLSSSSRKQKTKKRSKKQQKPTRRRSKRSLNYSSDSDSDISSSTSSSKRETPESSSIESSQDPPASARRKLRSSTVSGSRKSSRSSNNDHESSSQHPESVKRESSFKDPSSRRVRSNSAKHMKALMNEEESSSSSSKTKIKKQKSRSSNKKETENEENNNNNNNHLQNNPSKFFLFILRKMMIIILSFSLF